MSSDVTHTYAFRCLFDAAMFDAMWNSVLPTGNCLRLFARPGIPLGLVFFFLSFLCLVHEHSEWRLPTNLSQRLCSVNDALESIDDVEPSTKWLAYGYVNGAPRRSSYNFAVEAREKPIQQH